MDSKNGFSLVLDCDLHTLHEKKETKAIESMSQMNHNEL